MRPTNQSTSAVLKVGEGRGFMVKRRTRGDRIIITAAHCLPHLPLAHPASFRGADACSVRWTLSQWSGPSAFRRPRCRHRRSWCAGRAISEQRGRRIRGVGGKRAPARSGQCARPEPRRSRRRRGAGSVAGWPLACRSSSGGANGLVSRLKNFLNREAPRQANFFSDPFGLNQQAQQQAPAPCVAGYGPAFCVRSCDGKYFPLTLRGNATPVALCQAFCPASATKVYYGGNIDDATASNGERYADSENAFAYRKALRADCTCNGRAPSGLAPVDLTLDTSLRPGFKDLWQARQGRPDPPAVGAQRPQERRERGLAVVAGNPPLREG